jgi:uncharacterized membrane protein YhfC
MQRKLEGSRSRISSTVSAAMANSANRTCVIIFSCKRSTSCATGVGAAAGCAALRTIALTIGSRVSSHNSLCDHGASQDTPRDGVSDGG